MTITQKLRFDVPLASRVTLGTGGNARVLVKANSEGELAATLRWAAAESLEVLILGGGSNLVISDEGFRGLVVQVAMRGITSAQATASEGAPPSVEVQAAAGEPWDDFVAHCVKRGWAGIECLSGIPGLVGATPVQNVGAYGQEVSATIDGVRCLDRTTLEVRRFAGPACEFAYRSSRFKTRDKDRYVITAVTFRLLLAPPELPRSAEIQAQLPDHPTLQQVRDAVLATRKRKSMVWDLDDPNHRSCGSFFMNPVLSPEQFQALCSKVAEDPPHHLQKDGRLKVPAAWLIQQAGFSKGHRSGQVGLSTKHTLCVVAHDGATSAEVVEFARVLRAGVLQRFGVELHPEPELVGIQF